MSTPLTRHTLPLGPRLAEIRVQGREQRLRELRQRTEQSITRAERLMTALAQVEEAEEIIRRMSGDSASASSSP